MIELLAVLVLALLVIATATLVGSRIGIASPLIMVIVGVAASFLPMFGSVHIDPELIIAGVLPPLLYSSAVSMPSMNFRRELGAISGLSVVLVIGTSLVLGLFFMFVIPGLGFAWGVAIGAIISPTDAVATSMVRKTSVSKRVVAILDGESLLNDATALVLLRTAIVAMAGSFSFWGAVGTFAYSVAIAVVIGGIVGWLNLAVRRRITDPTVNTVISFTVPFLASIPAELLHGSGLVAAAVAGLVTGFRAPRELSPQNRLSDSQNWRTVELVLEGAVFLTMGIQITSILNDVQRDHAGVGVAVLIAAGALVITLLVRAAYVAPLLRTLTRKARRGEKMQARLHDMQEKMGTTEGAQETIAEINARSRRPVRARNFDQFATRVTRTLADIEYFLRAPLGWRDGVAVVWAGMRGAVTVAAAQTLPESTPHRSVLVLVAFAVALMSLLIQGGTIGLLLGRLTPQVDDAATEEQTLAEREQIFALMRSSTELVPEPDRPDGVALQEQFLREKKYRLAVLAAQRSALLDARDNGTFDADVLAHELANLDASQIAIEMRG